MNCCQVSVTHYSGKIPRVLVMMKTALQRTNMLVQKGIFAHESKGEEADILRARQLIDHAQEVPKDLAHVIPTLIKQWRVQHSRLCCVVC